MTAKANIQTFAIPAVSALLLVLVILFGRLTTREVPGTAAFHERVKSAVQLIPSKIGDWQGRDVEPEASATEILAPVIIMQRQYRNQRTGQVVNLLVVYCNDTRNLNGHYPPICYPNVGGWAPTGQQPENVSLLEEEFVGVNYTFDRVVNGVDRKLSVLNFMVSPSGTRPILRDMDSLTNAAPSRFTPGLGAGQVQILGLDALDDKTREEAKTAFLGALEHAISVIAEGA